MRRLEEFQKTCEHIKEKTTILIFDASPEVGKIRKA